MNSEYMNNTTLSNKQQTTFKKCLFRSAPRDAQRPWRPQGPQCRMVWKVAPAAVLLAAPGGGAVAEAALAAGVKWRISRS